MGLVINTNVASLNSQRNLTNTTNELSTTLQRLSTGLRINSAKDDAAGLAISERMTSQIRGLDQASRNANDAISLAQTAEGAMGEVTTVLQRMRELAVQSANDTNTSNDRTALQAEVTQLLSELNRISETTTFNGQSLLDGTLTNKLFQVGADADQTISVSVDSTRSTSIGNNTTTINGTLEAAVLGGTTNNSANQTVTVSGTLGAANTTVVAGQSAKTIATNLNANQSSTGVSVEASTTATLSTVGALGGATSGTLNFSLTGDAAASINVVLADVTDFRDLADAINNVASTTGITATASGATVTLSHSQGADIAVSNFQVTDVAGNQTINFDGGSGSAVAVTEGAANNTAVVGGQLDFSSTDSFNVQTDTTGTLFTAATTASTLAAVSSVDISTQTGANSALAVIDAAIDSISSNRADLGAIQNRLDSTIRNLNTTSENVSAARSRIRDTDFAAETAKLTKTQILQQAGLSMLSQANASPQSVLSLLG